MPQINCYKCNQPIPFRNGWYKEEGWAKAKPACCFKPNPQDAQPGTPIPPPKPANLTQLREKSREQSPTPIPKPRPANLKFKDTTGDEKCCVCLENKGDDDFIVMHRVNDIKLMICVECDNGMENRFSRCPICRIEIEQYEKKN